jgi:hypothetical protein
MLGLDVPRKQYVVLPRQVHYINFPGKPADYVSSLAVNSRWANAVRHRV